MALLELGSIIEDIGQEEDNKMITNELNILSKIAIYGAQMVAVSVYYAIKTIYPDCEILAFIVSSKEGNPSFVDGVPVVTVQEFDDKDTQILIAVPENFHQEISVSLENRDFYNYVCIDSEKEAGLMQKFYEKTKQFDVLSFCEKGIDKADVFVGMSKFYKDRKLKRDYVIPEWVHPIQVGAELTDICVVDLQDNKGDNISSKNVNYCELTAMYWLSKHISQEYMGLFHYRRMLDVTEEDLYRLCSGEIDIVLPYPTVHYPNILEHHKRYLKEEDWKAMVQALEEVSPEYAKKMSEVFEGQYFYNYNMLIAKEEVFKDYCNWLFPILARTEELSVPKGSERCDRYIGYMGENLTTLYFMVNKNKLKIVHTGRKMLI